MPPLEGVSDVPVAPAGARRLESIASRVAANASTLAVCAVALTLAFVTFVAFLPTLWNGFVQWDDRINLIDNFHYRGLRWNNLHWMFTTMLMGHYIPLTWLTFGLDYVLWGMNPAGYHFTSLVLHAANAALFYFVALRVLRKAATFSDTSLQVSATTAALFFALHPLRVESVAWATERRDVLSGLFFFLTLAAYLSASDASGRRRRRLLIGSIVCYTLALASKSIVMTLPLVLTVLDFYPLRRLDGRWRHWSQPPALTVWREKLPYIALGLVGGAVSYWAQNTNAFFTPMAKYPLEARVGIVGYSLWFHISKTAVPLQLSPMYELPARLRLLDPPFLASWAAIVIITGTLLALRRRWPAGIAAWAYYAIVLAPVSGAMHSGFQLTNDRYSYLPCLSFAVLVGAAAGVAVKAAKTGAIRPALARAAALIATLWFIGLGALTWQQIRLWGDNETLWRFALEANPNCGLCQSNLASILGNKGYPELAKQGYERVLQLRPDYVRTHNDLGRSLLYLDQVPEAIQHFKRVQQRYPSEPNSYSLSGVAMLQMGRFEDALGYAAQAVVLDPKDPNLHTNLGIVLLVVGRPGEGLNLCVQAARMNPDSPQPYVCLTLAHLGLGNIESARAQYQKLRLLDPRLATSIGHAFLTGW